MTTTKLGFWTMLSCLSVAGNPPAHAALISGSLSGTVVSGMAVEPTGQLVDISGADFSETFALNTLAQAAPTYVGSGISYTNLGGSFAGAPIELAFMFSKAGLLPITVPITGGSNTLVLADDGTTQSAGLFPEGDVDGFPGVSLSGPVGSLFTSVGLVDTLHIGPGAMLDAPEYIGLYKELPAIFVNVTGETLVSSVPEPATWTLLAGCLGAMACVLVTRRRTTN